MKNKVFYHNLFSALLGEFKNSESINYCEMHREYNLNNIRNIYYDNNFHYFYVHILFIKLNFLKLFINYYQLP